MDLNKMVQGLMSSGVGGGIAGGLASGLLVNALGKKKTRKMAGSALKLGGAAVVGGLAWKAYQNYRENQSAGNELAANTAGTNPSNRALQGSQSPADPWQHLQAATFMPTEPGMLAHRDLVMLRCMIAAAHADGHIDRVERQQIFQRIETLDLQADEKSRLFDEILDPHSVSELAAGISEPALAAEAYMAALVMSDTSVLSCRAFLADLSEQLQLPAELVKAMHQEARQLDSTSPATARKDSEAMISPLA